VKGSEEFEINDAVAGALTAIAHSANTAVYRHEFEDGSELVVSNGTIWAVGGAAALVALGFLMRFTALYLIKDVNENLIPDFVEKNPLVKYSLPAVIGRNIRRIIG